MKPYIIAECGINHNGDIELAKRMISVAKDIGCDAVKFQKRTIDRCYTQQELGEPCESPWGRTRRDKLRGRELSPSEYHQIDQHCKKVKIEWSASAWDMESLIFLDTFGLPWNKIASCMIGNEAFVRNVAIRRRLTLVSTGHLNWDGVKMIARLFDRSSCPFVLMHCVARYPCEPERLNLRCIQRMRRELLDEFPHLRAVGYSGHEVGISTTIAAIALGATYIERHFTLDRTMYGADQAASVEPHGMRKIVQYARTVSKALGDGEKRLYGDEKQPISVGIDHWF